jgi:hypothetical protein
MKRFLSALLGLMLLTLILSAPVAMAEMYSASTPIFDGVGRTAEQYRAGGRSPQRYLRRIGRGVLVQRCRRPRTSGRGYVGAVNGRGVVAMGGGVSQVAATLYLALKQMDGIEYLEKKTYGSKFTEDYVDSGSTPSSQITTSTSTSAS